MILCIVNSGITTKELILSIARTLSAFLDVTKIDDYYLTHLPNGALVGSEHEKKLDNDTKLVDSNVKDRVRSSYDIYSLNAGCLNF
jgi:hypothetical protein